MKSTYLLRDIYEASPRFIRESVGRILGKIPDTILYGKEFSRTWNLIEKSKNWDSKKFEEHQITELRNILILAGERVPYYRRIFKEISFQPKNFSSFEQLAALPLLTRTMVQELGKDLLVEGLSKRSYKYSTTGGTSGKPLGFYITHDATAIEWAFMLQNWGYAGFCLGNKRAVFRGRVIKNKRHPWDHDPVNKAVYFSSFHLDDKNLDDYINVMLDYKPDFIHAYPSTATVLAQYLDKHRVTIPSVKGLLLGSENFYSPQKQYLEQVFGCRAYSWYGHSEKCILAGACDLTDGYWSFPLYGFTELVNEVGGAITRPGERGLLVGTGFINKATLFIRYLTDDEAEWGGNDRSSQSSMILKNVRGRWNQECLIGKSGSKIFMTAINFHDGIYTRLRRFQFVQNIPGKAVLRIVPADNWTIEDEKNIYVEFRQRVDHEIDLDIEIVSDIELTSSGKFKFIDQHIVS
jgi:phenylacetate-CoA ligase